ncbi:unnamed protein product [Rhizophagus irregularis]|nr:unnamed protein product [Rhizophagus irregularis]
MPFYNLSKAELKSYQRKHRRGRTINQKEVYCIQCYPTDSIPADNIPDGFEKFWLWISIQYTAKQYTGATVAAFKVLKTEFFITTQLNTLVGITTKILQSIKFRQINTPLLELSFYLHKLFELTNGFKSLPTDTQVANAYQIFHNTPVNNNANMDAGQMRDLMKLVWGVDPTDNNNPRNVSASNLINAINALTVANQNRTTSKVVDVPFFYGRDDEDPYEWCRLFEAAFAANGWPDNRKIALAAGFLKEAARDWYEENRGNINQWHINNNAATQEEALAERYQINYYINGLKPFLVGQVVIGNAATLEATITRAKLVELGVNTTLLTTTPITANTAEPIPTTTTTTTVKPTPQVDEMEALTKQMQQLALNYANLSSVLMVQQSTPRNTRPRPNNNNQNRPNGQVPTQNSFNPNITCFRCGNVGHISRNCQMGRNTNNGNINGNNTNNNRSRQRAPVTPINYADDEAEIYYDEYEDEYEEEWEEEDEYEAYVTTRSRSVPKGLIQSMRRKREKVDNNNYIGESYYGDSNSEEETPTTAAKCEFHINQQPVIAVIDSGAAVSIMTTTMMKTLKLTIDGPSEYVIKTANGTRVRSLGEIQDLPLKVRNLIIKTNVQIIESSDSVFILENNWMRKVNAALDWNKKMLTIRYNGRSTTVPVIFTLPKPIKMKQSFEYDDEEEYESEELEEAQIYMSDFSGYSTEESLEFNPWENEVSPAHQNNEDEELEESNPAIYLVQAEVKLREWKVKDL